MNDVRHRVPRSGAEQSFGGADIVSNELVRHEATDLCVSDDECGAAGQAVLPVIIGGDISLYHLDRRMIPSKDGRVRRMFVDPGDRRKTATYQARDEVLTDEASRTGDDNAFVCHET